MSDKPSSPPPPPPEEREPRTLTQFSDRRLFLLSTPPREALRRLREDAASFTSSFSQELNHRTIFKTTKRMRKMIRAATNADA